MGIIEVGESSTGKSIKIRHTTTKEGTESQARNIANEIYFELRKIDQSAKRGGNFVKEHTKDWLTWDFDIKINHSTEWGSVSVPSGQKYNYFFVTLPKPFKKYKSQIIESLYRKIHS